MNRQPVPQRIVEGKRDGGVHTEAARELRRA